MAVIFDVLASIFRPFFIAVFLVYLLQPLIGAMTRRRVPAWIAHFVSIALVFAVLYGVGRLIVVNGVEFAENLPAYAASVDSWLESSSRLAVAVGLLLPHETLTIERLISALPPELVADVLGGGTSTFLSFMGQLSIILVFVIFILLETHRLEGRIRLAWGPARADAILGVVREINVNVQRYISIKVFMSVVTALLATVVMALFGLDFYFLFGFLIFLLNFIPYVGSILATLVPGALALIQFPSALSALWMFLLLGFIQFMIGSVIEPQVEGRNLNLSPVALLIVLSFFGWLWGPAGMVLGIPIMVSLRIALEHVPSMRPYAVLLSNNTFDDTMDP
jgi:predicted PurR-regulated permease PerM